jgi:solute carrier family 8 (sodium/calcium exchanger)
LGVFAVTASSSIFAYIWLYICLEIWSEGVISLAEALITFSFFIILIASAFIADKCRQRHMKNKSKKQGQFNIEDFYHILNLKQKNTNEESDGGALGEDKPNHAELQKYLKKTFNKERIEDIDPLEIEKMLKPQSVIAERIHYRKSVGKLITGMKKVNVKKGEKRVEELKTAQDEFQHHKLNPEIGFRCLHYSVTESAGTLKVIILKKNPDEDIKFGVRTVDGTACAGVEGNAGDYDAVDEIMNMAPGVNQLSVPVKIVDDEGIEPDEDFYIEIYDPETGVRLPGEDTRSLITILDDDKPGIFGFESRATKVRAKDEKIRLKVMRLDGCDDEITIKFKTFVPDYLTNQAEPSIDYMPCEGSLTFDTGETLKVIEVAILQKEQKASDTEAAEEAERDDVFAVKLYEPKYANEAKNNVEGIELPKLGKKNECFVEIVGDSEALDKARGIEEMIQALQNNEEVTYGQQFKNACMLSPQLDEDNNMIDVTGLEAFLHFVTIGWKLFFAIIPPAKLCKGWLSFIVCL